MMTIEEELFFSSKPSLLPLYTVLRERVMDAHPDVEIKVAKTQITFRCRHVFAMASVPFRRVKGWPEEYLLVSFGLAWRVPSDRIAQAVQPYPNRWTHHVIVQRPEEIDQELLNWLEEAYQFAQAK